MKCSELMVGDWIQGFTENTFAVILEISHTGRVVIATKDGQTISLNSEDIKPVPLTEQILAMNGFFRSEPVLFGEIESDTDWMIKLVDNFGSPIRIGYDLKNFHLKFGNTENDNCWMSIPAYYVHTLQLALRLARMNEIANNFKI